MKIAEILMGLGRAVVYYPNFVKAIGGNINAAIFLNQLIYWKGKEKNSDGWIYKTSAEIEEETALSYKKQKNARQHLKNLGIIEEKYKRLEHLIYYRINFDKLNEIWDNYISSLENKEDNKIDDSQKDPLVTPPIEQKDVTDCNKNSLANKQKVRPPMTKRDVREHTKSTPADIPPGHSFNSINIDYTEITTKTTTNNEQLSESSAARALDSKDEIIKEIFNTYEEEIGIITKTISDEILDLIDSNVSSKWIIDALKISARQNKRMWSYAKAIINRWVKLGAQIDMKSPNKNLLTLEELGWSGADDD